MQIGKKIELFLVNGTADSLIIAEIDNWNGCAYKISRSEIKNCAESQMSEVGFYFLFGQSDDTGLPTVYIGEAENVKKRLMQHIHDSSKEDYDWNTAVCFFGGNLNKAHVRYLERQLKKLAEDCGRCVVKTKNTFNTSLKRSEECSMLQFIDNVAILMHALGYNILVPQPKSHGEDQAFYCNGNGAEAYGYLSSGGFTIKKGSVISNHVAPSFLTNNKGIAGLRKDLEETGVIKDRAFTRDYEMGSCSGASCLVQGRPSNGKNDWKFDGKKTLGDYLKTL